MQGKVWGTTTVVERTPLFEVHALTVKPHSQCSMHKHERKWNAFMVRSGTLTIAVRKNDYNLVDETVLGPGDYATVKPGEYHRFISHDEPVEAWEVYYLEALSEDIVREDCGGPTTAPADGLPRKDLQVSRWDGI